MSFSQQGGPPGSPLGDVHGVLDADEPARRKERPGEASSACQTSFGGEPMGSSPNGGV